jgi:hypothetical protein
MKKFIFIIVLASAFLYGCEQNPKKENVYHDTKAEYLENQNIKLRNENASLKKEILRMKKNNLVPKP